MANLFEIALINPIRFVQTVTPDARFQNQPFDLVQPNPCYFQKFQTDDTTTIQVLSDFTDVLLKIYDLHTNALLATISPTTPDFSILSQTFKVYEFEIDFASLGVVDCYAQITYTDQSDIVQVWQSEPIQVLENQPDTLLLQYRNSENNFSTVFDTGIIFSLRVEGTIQNFKPEFDDVIYNDQLENATKLSSVPFRSFQLFIGGPRGVADWMGDKVNRASSCDMFQSDGQYYEKLSGEKWNMQRVVENEYLGMDILVMPVDNLFLDRLKTGNTPTGDYLPVQKELSYLGQAADLPIPSIFKKYSLVEKIVVYRSGDPFILKVGITPGGAEFGTFEIDDLVDTEHIDRAFEGVGTLYLSGIAGSLADIFVIYKQLDVKPITIGSPNPYASLGVGATVIYETPTGQDLSIDFNLGTGLGNVETDWYGWAICDGRNGTLDRGGVWPVGYVSSPAIGGDPAGPYNTPGDILINDGAILTIDNIPAHEHPTDMKPNMARAGSAIGGQGPPNSGMTGVAGSLDPVPVPIVPSYIVSLWVKKIAASE